MLSPPDTERGTDPRVLLIEDEPGIVDFVQRGLRTAGFLVEAAADGVVGEERALREHFDAIVLDLMLPRRGGLEVLRTLSSALPHVPVIILTARGETDERIVGLDTGAVDYLLKPFAVAELAARLRAQLRRAEMVNTLRAGDIEIDITSRDVRRDSQPVRLSTKEFELLLYLVRRRGRVCSREELLTAVWGYRHDPATNIVDVYVSYLRRKMALPDRPLPLVTVRSAGYRLTE
ncbi:MAG TPA: response regulator transcription factor [Solirubrobacteraceae bacterium]